MIHRATTTFLLTTVLALIPFSLLAQSLQEAVGADAGSGTAESATLETKPRIPFDSALVGLPGLPDPLATPEDFLRAQELIVRPHV